MVTSGVVACVYLFVSCWPRGESMKTLAVLFLVACGRSECENYAVVYCSKAVTCGYDLGGTIFRPNLSDCERDATALAEAEHATESLCKSSSHKVQQMDCKTFQDFANGPRLVD